MPGIDHIRPSDDGPDQPDAESTRPSWSDRWRAGQVARMEAEEAELRHVLAELEDAGDNRTVGEADRSERRPQSADPGGSPDGRGESSDESQRPATPDGSHPPADTRYGESEGQAHDHTKDMDRPARRAEALADEPDNPAHDVTAPSGHADTAQGWQRLSEPGEHVPWEQRLGGLGGPGKEVTSERRADDADLERVQVQRLEQRPDATAEHRAGDLGQTQSAQPQSYHATTIAGTGVGAGTDSPGRHADQTPSRPWWVETGHRPASPEGDQASGSSRNSHESTTVGSQPSEFDQHEADDAAPTSWVSDAFKIPGGTRVDEGWSAFPAGGDRAAGRAADVPPASDDFGPIDGERWRQVPCAEQRPQRVYELYKSEMPLTEAESDAIVRAKDKIAEVLGEASGRELTADDVQEALQYVNPTGAGDNCVECSKAVDDILRGHAATAGPTERQRFHYVEAALSARAIDYLEDISAVNIERQMLEAGSGARAIAIGWKHHSPAHAYNVANIGGEVYWLDGQRDLMTEHDPHGSRSFDLYRTG